MANFNTVANNTVVTGEPNTAASADQKVHGRHIVVVEFGFVFMADRVIRDGDLWRLEDTRIINEYGTSHGLGELAVKGPTANTKFDYCGIQMVPTNKVLFFIPCQFNKDIKQ